MLGTWNAQTSTIDAVTEEVERARLICRRNGWRIVDVTGKAVEENAARLIEYYELTQES